MVVTGQGVTRLTLRGAPYAEYHNVAIIVGPLVLVQIDFQHLDSPVPADEQRTVIANVAPRVAKG